MSAVSARLDPRVRISDIDRRLFGGFVEHLGRHIYDGIFEPSHPAADADGFRTDVIDLVRELGVSMIRYPGGNFVSGYRWEDGIGPREHRPRRLDLAWHATETNQVGLHEFADWTRKVGSELMLAVNLGTRGVEEAIDLVEYANRAADTQRTRERAANGRAEPFGVSMWCLGNEMDGDWQLGHRNATDYGKLAARTAKAMRQVDPRIELVACGSSNRDMPTFGVWEREVLEQAFDDVDFISAHAYYEEFDGDAQEFLASAEDMRRFIEQVIATADHVAAVRKSDKRIQIAFDEWNVWYHKQWEALAVSYGPDEWPIAPRQLEDRYSVIDAVVVGDLLITLLQHASRVRSASLAQLVNVIAPIMTEPGGPTWRQTTFFPFSLTSRLSRAHTVRLDVQAGTVPSSRFGEIAQVNAVATADDDGASIFVVNRSINDTAEITIDLSALTATLGRTPRVQEVHLLHDDDRYASNTLAHPERVVPTAPEGLLVTEQSLTMTLPAVSWAAISLG